MGAGYLLLSGDDRNRSTLFVFSFSTCSISLLPPTGAALAAKPLLGDLTILGEAHHRRALHDGDIGLLEPVAASRPLETIVNRRRLDFQVELAFILQPLEHRLQYPERHLRERWELLVVMDPDLHVHLGEGAQPELPQDVQQQPALDAVAGEERDALEDLPPAGVLARERLHEPGELRPEQVQHRARGELGHAPSARRPQDAAVLERPLVERLDVADLRLGEQRPNEPVQESRVDVLDVGVDPDDDVAFQDEDALPQRLAFAGRGRHPGEDLVIEEYLRALGPRDVEGSVRAARVDDADLVDEWVPLDQLGSKDAKALPDGLRHVEGRQADAYLRPLPLLEPDELADVRELAVMEGALLEPLLRCQHIVPLSCACRSRGPPAPLARFKARACLLCASPSRCCARACCAPSGSRWP